MFAEVDDACRLALESERVPSISYAVGAAGEVAHARAFGIADLATGREATAGTAYLLASATKPITATAILRLAAEGRLALDDPLERHLGGLRLPRSARAGADAPTIAQALSHTAGLATHWDFAYPDGGRERFPLPVLVERYGILHRPPGERLEYSNLGYGLLDAVIGSASGREPAEYVRDEVLARVGAPSGRVGHGYRGPAPAAERYSADLVAYPEYDTSHRGASMGWATASDLVRFGLAHTRTGDPGWGLDAGHLPHAEMPGDPDGTDYGYGWGVRRIGDRTVLSHGGDMGGVGTNLTVLPDDGIAVAVLVNRTDTIGLAGAIRDRLLAVLVEGLPPLRPDRAPHAGDAAPATGDWAGVVRTHLGELPVRLSIRDDGHAEVALDSAPPRRVTVQGPEDPGDWAVDLAVSARLPTPDARAAGPLTRFVLDPRDGGLVGQARALKDDEAGHRVGNCLSHVCELGPA